jgi:TorA maturation chaperone TorD
MAELTDNELKDIVGLRRNLYGFLARGYASEIDKTYLEQIKELLPVLKDFANNFDDQMFIVGVENLEKYINGITDIDEEIEDKARRFCSLFLNVSPNDVIKHVHPFESVYLSPERLVMQEQRDEVLEFYAKYGLGVDENFKEPEDHIAAELSFLSVLNEQVLNDLNNGDTQNAIEKLKGHLEFMEKHLLKWIHLLGMDLRNADEGGFYGTLADLTMGFARIDYKFLKEFIEYLEEESLSK